MRLLPRFERLNKIRDLGSARISFDWLRIQHQSLDEIFIVWAYGLCSLYRGFPYAGIHYTITLTGLKNIVRYSGPT